MDKKQYNPVKYRQKKSYSINEVADIFKVNVWTIRLWCNRFEILEPQLNKKGGILFTPADVERIGVISHLAKEKNMTLDDVRKELELMKGKDASDKKNTSSPTYEGG